MYFIILSLNKSSTFSQWSCCTLPMEPSISITTDVWDNGVLSGSKLSLLFNFSRYPTFVNLAEFQSCLKSYSEFELLLSSEIWKFCFLLTVIYEFLRGANTFTASSKVLGSVYCFFEMSFQPLEFSPLLWFISHEY